MLYNVVHWSNPSLSKAKYLLWQHQTFIVRKKNHVQNGCDISRVPDSICEWEIQCGRTVTHNIYSTFCVFPSCCLQSWQRIVSTPKNSINWSTQKCPFLKKLSFIYILSAYLLFEYPLPKISQVSELSHIWYFMIHLKKSPHIFSIGRIFIKFRYYGKWQAYFL